MNGGTRSQLHGADASDTREALAGRRSMRVRPRPPIRLLLLLQAEQRTGRLVWRSDEGAERSLLLASGLVVGTEGQTESFLEYLARACRIPPATLGRIERRVRDLFLPLETEIARSTGLALEELAANRRDFTLQQLGELCLRDEDPAELRFEDEEIPIPGAACQVPPATALADLLLDRLVREGRSLVFPPGILRPTRLFPRLSILLELAFPWRLPLPRAGGEPGAAILERCGADRASALYLLLAGGLLAEEAAESERHKPPTILPGVALPVVGGPLAALEALEARLAEDPFNQEAIEAIERLAAEEGWPEVLVEMQERQLAKAPPPQRGYYYLRLAALADVAALPDERHTEIVLLGRRSIPRDMRLACAQAYQAFLRGDQEGARTNLSSAGVPWPPPGDHTTLVAPPRTPALETPSPTPAPQPPARPAAPTVANVSAEPPTVIPAAPAPPSAESAVVVAEPPAAPTPAPAPPAAVTPAPAATGTADAGGSLDLLPDSLGPLMAALRTGDEDTLHAWLRDSLPALPRVRRASQALLDAAQTPGAERSDHVARFARALGHALDELPPAPDPEAGNLRADLFVQLTDLLTPVDRAAALVAAERAVIVAPDHEPAQEKLERLAIEARDAETYARGFAVVEERLEGAHNKWAFAYRQGRTLETEFGRTDLALAAYLRALAHQPRTGAVLAAIERLAKGATDETPLIEAYRLLAASSDGAQRAYWRSKLAGLGVIGPVIVEDTDWGDLLEESLPSSTPPTRVDEAKAAAPAASEAAVQAPTAAGTTPPETPATGSEPARGIEEALLRATPAFGIPVMRLFAPPESGPAAVDVRPAVAPPPPAPPEQPSQPPPVTPATVVADTPPVETRAAPPEPIPSPAGAPEPAAETSPAPAAEVPPPPAVETVPAAEPEAAPAAPPSDAVPSPAAPAEPGPTETTRPSRDVSWLDDEVEMVIEYPGAQAPAASPAGTAPSAATTPESRAAPEASAPVTASEPPSAAPPPAESTEATSGAAAGEVQIGERREVREARVRLDGDVTDLEALRALRDVWRKGGDQVPCWVADSVLGIFDPSVVPEPPPVPALAPPELVLSRCGPWDARFLHRAMSVVWEHCASTFAEELPAAIRPAHQVSPMGEEALARGVAECSERLAFFRFQVYRRPESDEVVVLRTRPPSLLVSRAMDPGRPADLTRLAVGVARCVPEHLLPSTLSPSEREALLQGLLCAFGPPGCVPRIPQRAATVAQDLWHFIPPRAQALLRTELAAADVAESGAWLTEVHARCLLLGARVSRDLRTALRLGLSIDAAVPPDRPLREAEFRDALRWSSVSRRLLRAVLSEGFWLGFPR